MIFSKLFWLILSDCESNEDCFKLYPANPICESSSGKCVPLPDDLKPPEIYDKNDMCKKLYGGLYVFDPRSKSCRVPKCPRGNCPEPSQCWRGSCEVFPKEVEVEKCSRYCQNCVIQQCEKSECDPGPCNRDSVCFQHFCLPRRLCSRHGDCDKSEKCVWGQCFQVSQGCHAQNSR